MQKNSKILIVEDEMLIAHSLKTMVDKHFECIGIAKNYDEAVHFLNISEIDLVLIDITLQDEKTGIDLAKTVKEFFQIPFIFLTALTDEETLQKIIEAKPNAYLAKPIQEPNIVTAINLAILVKEEEIISLSIGKNTYRININHFLYAEAEGVYVSLFFKQEKPLLVRSTLSFLEQIFPKTHFRRINRSEALNPKLITKTQSSTVFLGEKSFKISENYLNKF